MLSKNIDFNGYKFVHSDSIARSGGVDLCILESLAFTIKTKIKIRDKFGGKYAGRNNNQQRFFCDRSNRRWAIICDTQKTQTFYIGKVFIYTMCSI